MSDQPKEKKSSLGKELNKINKRLEGIRAKIDNFEIQCKKNVGKYKELKKLEKIFCIYQKDIKRKLEKINSKLKQKSQ